MDTIFACQYRQGSLTRFVRADDAHTARVVARDTWGMTVVKGLTRHYLDSTYGAIGYDEWVNSQYKVVDTMAAAVAMKAAKAKRQITAWYDPAKARRIAKQHEHVTI